MTPSQAPDSDPSAKSAPGWRGARGQDLTFAVLLCALSVALWAPRLRGAIDLRFDAGVYYVTGTALAEGKGYRLLNEPREPLAVQYPPLLPALVAAHQLVLGTSDPAEVGPWLRRSYFLIFTAYLLSAYAVARLHLRPPTAFLATVVASLFLLTYYLSDLLFAEIPFALASMLFILCNRRSQRPAWFAAAGLLGATAYLLRSAGIALLAAWVVEALVQRKWTQLGARLAVTLVPVVAWHLYLGNVTSSSEYEQPAYRYQRAAYQYYNVPYAENIRYVNPFRPEDGVVSPTGMAARVMQHALIMPPRLGEIVSAKVEFWDWLFWDFFHWLHVPKLATWVAQVPLTIFGLLVLAGAALLLLRRGEPFVPVYLAATIGLLSLTPWPAQFARYLTPLAPLLATCLLLALTAMRRHTRQRWPDRWKQTGRIVMASVLAVSLFMQAYTLARTFRSRPGEGLGRYGEGAARLFYYDQTWSAYAEALHWVRGHARPGDVIAASIPHWAYLQSGVKTVLPPMEADPAEAQALLDDVPVRYLIVDQVRDVDTARVYGQPVIDHNPDRWQLVHAIPHVTARSYQPTETRVYRRIDQPAPRLPWVRVGSL